MKGKLTLSIDEEKIKKIKKYSKKEGVSVSQIVEDSIDKITSNSSTKRLDASKLIGILGKSPKGFDWKKVRTDYLIEKYGL
ncbi:MAG: DUF6364 family protein [Ginsengibacter sp.]